MTRISRRRPERSVWVERSLCRSEKSLWGRGWKGAVRRRLSFRASAESIVIPSERRIDCHSERAQNRLSFRASGASRGIRTGRRCRSLDSALRAPLGMTAGVALRAPLGMTTGRGADPAASVRSPLRSAFRRSGGHGNQPGEVAEDVERLQYWNDEDAGRSRGRGLRHLWVDAALVAELQAALPRVWRDREELRGSVERHRIVRASMHLSRLASFALAAVVTACATSNPVPRTAPTPGRWELLPQGERPTRRHENGYVRVGDRFYLVGG